jgi:exosortase
MLIAHGATVAETIAIWNRSETYKFAWVVLPTLAYLLWHNRRRLAMLTPLPSASGIVVATACGAMWIAGDLLNIAEGRQLALVAAICAVVLATMGWSVFRVLLPFLCLLVFLVPTGGFLLAPLKQIAVGSAQGYARLVGLPFRTDGFSMFVGTQRYVVIDYCAALPYVLCGMFLGLTLGLLIYRSWWKNAALSLLGAGLAIVANCLRIAGIITYDYLTGSKLTVAQHAYFELPALALCAAVLFFIFSRLTPDPTPTAPSHRPARARGTTLKCITSAVVAVILVSSTPYLWQETPELSGNRESGPMLPETLSGWSRHKSGTDWQPRVLMKTVDTALTTYELGQRRVSIFIAQTTSRRDKVSGGAIDLVGDEMWMPALRQRLAVCASARCYEVQHSKHLLRNSDRIRQVYTAYAIGNEITDSPFELRIKRAWATLRGAKLPAKLIAIASEDAGGITPAEIATFIQASTLSD